MLRKINIGSLRGLQESAVTLELWLLSQVLLLQEKKGWVKS